MQIFLSRLYLSKMQIFLFQTTKVSSQLYTIYYTRTHSLCTCNYHIVNRCLSGKSTPVYSSIKNPPPCYSTVKTEDSTNNNHVVAVAKQHNTVANRRSSLDLLPHVSSPSSTSPTHQMIPVKRPIYDTLPNLQSSPTNNVPFHLSNVPVCKRGHNAPSYSTLPAHSSLPKTCSAPSYDTLPSQSSLNQRRPSYECLSEVRFFVFWLCFWP